MRTSWRSFVLSRAIRTSEAPLLSVTKKRLRDETLGSVYLQARRLCQHDAAISSHVARIAHSACCPGIRNLQWISLRSLFWQAGPWHSEDFAFDVSGSTPADLDLQVQ